MKQHTTQSKNRNGFSLIEMLVVVSIIGIATAIGITAMGNISSKAKEATARDITEKLNHGVRSFSHANWDLTFNAVAASGGDEVMVLRSLQYRDPNDPSHGSPYFRNDWHPKTSNNTDDYRIQWTGSAYKLLLPEEEGYGLKVRFDAGDIGDPFVFPNSFTPVGSR